MKKFKKWLARALFHLGRYQGDRVRKADYNKVDGLFEAVYRRLSSAALLDPENPKLFHYWGSVLYEQASQYKDGKTAKDLCKASGNKFETALKLDPENAKIMNDWAAALIGQAKESSDKSAATLLHTAQEKINAAEAITLDIGTYNLACIYSLRNEGLNCKRYLERAKEINMLPPVVHLKMDRDLDNIRKEPWFEAFIKQCAEIESQNKAQEPAKKSWWQRLLKRN
ncbi:TPR end-of-group domain-containing protein [Candidatus Nitrosacidococcus sp. I8]|uniref:TPR end-of-group domain-containing protein n=1 Tax=Candidatus Nitrosacidococcus sp. I8 TaxID=2942908 RepID=UPI0022280772|nr:hypothetical protein [Candidatus Nitrosacidococcus sp. I8]CAH9019388.1 hypothetical protein NURINAE_01518 [Candidatus Nitrosacidococcus sp. I8]